MNALTARLALDQMALRPGEVLAVTGAAGAFGGYVVQLAKADGLTVVADASEADEELVRTLGADVVVRRGDDVAARIREQFPRRRRRAGRRRGAGRARAAGRAATAARWRRCAATAGTGSAALRMYPTLVRRVAQDRAGARPAPPAGRGRRPDPARGARRSPPSRRPRRTGCSRRAACAGGWCSPSDLGWPVRRTPCEGPTVNGAQALIRTLVAAGVDVCFANPGTSEMHFVAALDDVPEMRGVLTLFEGVATGAADGYARMAGRPAATLLHLGPGLGNGLANLHNARRGRAPLVNVVGDHARSHKRLRRPAREPTSTRSPARSRAGCGARCPRPTSPPTPPTPSRPPPRGQVATLILPADVSWEDGAEPADPPSAWPPRRRTSAASPRRRGGAADSGEPTVLFLGGDVVASEEGLLAAGAGSRPAPERG